MHSGLVSKSFCLFHFFHVHLTVKMWITLNDIALLWKVLCKYNWIDWYYVSEGVEWQRTEDRTQQPPRPEEEVHRCFCRWKHIFTPNWMWQTDFCLGLTEKPDPNPAVFVCPHRTLMPYSCSCCFTISIIANLQEGINKKSKAGWLTLDNLTTAWCCSVRICSDTPSEENT